MKSKKSLHTLNKQNLLFSISQIFSHRFLMAPVSWFTGKPLILYEKFWRFQQPSTSRQLFAMRRGLKMNCFQLRIKLLWMTLLRRWWMNRAMHVSCGCRYSIALPPLRMSFIPRSVHHVNVKTSQAFGIAVRIRDVMAISCVRIAFGKVARRKTIKMTMKSRSTHALKVQVSKLDTRCAKASAVCRKNKRPVCFPNSLINLKRLWTFRTSCHHRLCPHTTMDSAMACMTAAAL